MHSIWGSSASAASNSDISDGAESGSQVRGAGRAWRAWRGPAGQRARPGWQGRLPYAWLAAPVVAALVVAWASAVPLGRAGVPHRAAAVAALLAGSAVLAVTPGVAVVSVAARWRQLGPASALGLLYAGAGTAAMAGFWAWFHSPALGVRLDEGLLAVSVAVIAVCGRRGDLGRLGLSLPLALALAVSALYTGVLFLQGTLTPLLYDQVGHIIWMEPDNGLPMLFAARVAAHAPLGVPLTSTWLTSDRPPLQTGFVLLQWPLWAASGRGSGYQFLGTVLQSAWLPALWTAFRVLGVSVRRTCTAVLATAATAVMFFNVVYVWPKMLAGGLALAALAILVRRDAGDRPSGDRWRGAVVLAAALAALSMLAHGGTAFSLIALIPFLFPLRRKVTVRTVAAGAAAVAVLYLPWVLYQRFVVPPGDRLLKVMLAGVIPIDNRGALQAIIEQYRSLSPGQLLGNKWENITELVANVPLWRHTGAGATWVSGFFGWARIAQLTEVVPAAGLLLLGGVALLLPSARSRLAEVKPLAAFTALSVAVWAVLIWGGPVATGVIEGPYAAIVAFVALCALAVTALPRVLAGVILTASAAWFAVDWVPGLAFRPWDPRLPASSPVDWSMAILCACALAAIIAITTVACRPRERTEDQDPRDMDYLVPSP